VRATWLARPPACEGLAMYAYGAAVRISQAL